jgi:oligopeptide transport system substrate-binding protein
MRKKLLAFLIISALMICTFASCADSAATPSEDNTFRYAVSILPTTLDPTMCNSLTDNELQHAVTEGLTRTTGGNVAPGIAESWDVSDDGLVYTFHLRDAKWSDGQPITADDFVYSWRRLADPKTGSSYAFAVWMVKNGKEINLEGADPETLGIKALDDKTVQVTLVNPTAYFISYIGNQPSFAPLRKDYVEKYGKDFATSAETNVYSGPFVFSEVTENSWSFKKNPEFWDAENIRIDAAEVKYTKDEHEQVEMFENGELDFAYLPNDAVNEYKNEKNVNHYLNGNVDFCYINDKSDNKVLANTEFRLALNYALNRKLYNHNANDDAYKPYNGLVFPGLSGKEGVTYGEAYNVDMYAFPMEGDIDLARSCLENSMEQMEIASPDDITVEMVTIDRDAELRIAEELKSQWESVLGIHIKIRPEDHTDIYSTIYPSGDYEIGFGGWIPDYNDPYTYLELWRSDNTSYNQYSNEDFDALLDASVTETDPEVRMDMLNNAEILLLAEGALIPLQAKDKYYMLNPRVSDLTLSFFNITIDWAYAGLEDVKPVTGE